MLELGAWSQECSQSLHNSSCLACLKDSVHSPPPFEGSQSSVSHRTAGHRGKGRNNTPLPCTMTHPILTLVSLSKHRFGVLYQKEDLSWVCLAGFTFRAVRRRAYELASCVVGQTRGHDLCKPWLRIFSHLEQCSGYPRVVSPPNCVCLSKISLQRNEWVQARSK